MHGVESPRMDDAGLEPVLQSLAVAPRVTLEQVRAAIKGEQYIRVDGTTLTICVLHLQNGFTVTGESAAASMDNFNEAIGRQLAFSKALDKVWSHEGYLLRQKLHEAADPTGQHDVEAIARMCHEVNRAYCQALGDNSHPCWEDAPQWQRDSAMAGVRMHLAQPDAGPEASHASWMQQKLDEGWSYGPTKSPETKQHPCMVPFEELPKAQQAKDFIFRAVVHALVDI